MKNAVFILSLFDTGYYAARQLRRLDCTILGFDYNPKNAGFFSNFIEAILCPHPNDDEEALLKLLLDKRFLFNKKPVIIPASEPFVFFVNKYQNILKNDFLFLLPEKSILDDILNKEKQILRALKSGLNIAPILEWDINSDNIPEIKSKFIIRASDQIKWKKNIKEKAFLINNTKSLAQTVQKLKEKNISFICQQIIEGDITNNYEFNALMINGKFVHSYVIKKLQQYPLGFGAACAVKIVNDKKEIETIGKRFVIDNCIEGFSNTEFKFDPFSGKYIFIETNPRVWQQIELSSDNKDNIMIYYYKYLTNNEKGIIESSYKAGKLWIDLPSILLLFKKYRKESGLELIKLFKYLLFANYYGLLNLSDLKPFTKTVLSK